MAATPTRNFRNVLLVEDHETTRITLAGVIEREGCRVVAVASSGAKRPEGGLITKRL